MKIKEAFSLTGRVYVRLDYKDKQEDHYKADNLIVLLPRQRLLSTIYSTSSIVADPITTLKVGNGGSIDAQGLYPRPVSKAMTALFAHPSSVYSFPLTTPEDGLIESAPSILFVADIAEEDMNGVLINEIGLFTQGGTMFSIKTLPAIPKTSTFSVHVEWTIDFS